MNGSVKASLLLLGGERLLWAGLRVHHLQVARQLGCRQAVSSNVRKAPIVRDPKDERTLGTFTTKSWKGTPDGYDNLLKEILPFCGIWRVNTGNPSERWPMCLKQSTELPIEVRRIQRAPERYMSASRRL